MLNELLYPVFDHLTISLLQQICHKDGMCKLDLEALGNTF